MVDTATTKMAPASPVVAVRQGYWRGVFRRLLRDPGGLIVGTLILLLLALALFGPWLIVKDPYQTSMFLRLKPIGSDGFVLGSDELGRDMLSRLILGARLSLFMGIVPVVFAFFIGGAIGIIAGYAGGKTNTLIMRTVDVFYASFGAAGDCALRRAGGGHWQCAAVVDAGVRAAGGADCGKRYRPGPPYGLYRGRPRYRGQRLYHYSRPGPRQRAGSDFVFSTGLISVCMILASGLSFLGLGVRPPEPEWGLMLNTLRTAIYTQPWVAALPGLMIFITSISFNILADRLRTAMAIKE